MRNVLRSSVIFEPDIRAVHLPHFLQFSSEISNINLLDKLYNDEKWREKIRNQTILYCFVYGNVLAHFLQFSAAKFPA